MYVSDNVMGERRLRVRLLAAPHARRTHRGLPQRGLALGRLAESREGQAHGQRPNRARNLDGAQHECETRRPWPIDLVSGARINARAAKIGPPTPVFRHRYLRRWT